MNEVQPCDNCGEMMCDCVVCRLCNCPVGPTEILLGELLEGGEIQCCGDCLVNDERVKLPEEIRNLLP